jgi:tRNA threonylcarbamoyladenosine biosynthesis protein TsaE
LESETLYDVVTHSPEETLAFGRSLAQILKPPCAVLLEGDLGSGKTVLTKGIVAGLGAAHEDEVTSPTFTLIHEYANGADCQSIKVYHVDLYRLEGRQEIESLGIDELLDSRSTTIIEWGEKFPATPSVPAFRIRLEALSEPDSDRKIVVQSLSKATQNTTIER